MKENGKKQKQVELTCDIVGDLLPLYYDEVVSEETKQAVSRHLALCEECSKEYNLLKEELPEKVNEEQKIENENRISNFLKKVRKQGILKGVIATAIAVLVLWGAGYALTEIPILSLPSNDISIKGVFEEDGSFFIAYKAPRYQCQRAVTISYGREKSQVYLNYKVPIIHFANKDEAEMQIMTLDKVNLEEAGCEPVSIVFNDKEIYQLEDIENQKEVPEYVKVYFEYSQSESGFEMDLDESTIGLSLLKEEGNDDLITTRYRKWDWEGNLLYDKEIEE